jgi:hypothetical protein
MKFMLYNSFGEIGKRKRFKIFSIFLVVGSSPIMNKDFLSKEEQNGRSLFSSSKSKGSNPFFVKFFE